MSNMFCYQCEQTAKGTGCTERGVCGKLPETSELQDELISSTINLALCNAETPEITQLIIKSLFTTVTNVNFDNNSIRNLLEVVKTNIQCDENFNIKNIWEENEDIKSLKSLILFGLKGISAYAYHSYILGYENDEVNHFFYEALQGIAKETDADKLLSLVLKTGKINLKCMEMLDMANVKTFGIPEPTKVTTNIEAGPFIVVSGHDLKDLQLLLEQTKDKGINIYTHSEMLPAHSYPELKKYPHLKGNFGTAWQKQQKEFLNLPAPILFTTNCLMPVKENYADRVFTTALVEYPAITHIDNNKDFTPVIEKSLELGGYKEPQNMTGINGGDTLTVGFGHNTILSLSEKLVELIDNKKIKHIFLVGGCDGAKFGRNYYTEFVKQTPKDTLILTLACGKYRFNDLDLGEIDDIPRILDVGQCNDAYSAIMVAYELSKIYNCSLNELPLSFILSWYEQKAVAILLTLLYLGVENIRLGPTLPVFISPNTMYILSEKFKIKQITTPENDLKEILETK